MKQTEIVCEEGGLRLDAFLAQRLNGFSRVFLKGLIERGNVTVGGHKRDSSYRVKQGETVLVVWPEEPAGPDLARCILLEDDELLVLDKPSGLLMHPVGTSWLARPDAALAEAEPTVVSLLQRLRPELANLPRVGLVHRLDRETSGVLLIAKTAAAHESFSVAFRDREVKKAYRAIVAGQVARENGTIDAPIGREGRRMAVSKLGRDAVTEYEVLERAAKATLVEARPLTGRTHQIRAHLTLAGHPVAGDPDAKTPGLPAPARMMLHAYRLEFAHPRTGKPVRCAAELPKDFVAYWKALKGAKVPSGAGSRKKK